MLPLDNLLVLAEPAIRLRLPLPVPGHPKPHKHRRYARAMTIALGVLCTDGIVLGVDLQYTQDATKTPGKNYSGCVLGGHILF